MVLTQQNGAAYVLCIAVDNSPILGSYLTDPGLQSAGVLDDPATARAWSFKTAAAPPAATPAASATSYSPGQAIPAAVVGADGVTLSAASGGSWSLPAAGGGAAGGASATVQSAGACILAGPGQRVSFGTPVPPTQCSVSAPLSASLCSALAAPRFSTLLRLGSAPQAAPAAPAGYVAPALGDVFVATLGAGGGSFVEVAANATAEVEASGAWEAAAGGGACTCANAVTGVAYAVSYSAATLAVTGVSVQLVLATLSQASGCGVAPLSLPLTVQVDFSPDAASVAAMRPSLGASNDEPYARSGSPGGAWWEEGGRPLYMHLSGSLTLPPLPLHRVHLRQPPPCRCPRDVGWRACVQPILVCKGAAPLLSHHLLPWLCPASHGLRIRPLAGRPCPRAPCRRTTALGSGGGVRQLIVVAGRRCIDRTCAPRPRI